MVFLHEKGISLPGNAFSLLQGPFVCYLLIELMSE